MRSLRKTCASLAVAFIFGAGLLAGCAMGPGPIGIEASLHLETGEWESADAGCEDHLARRDLLLATIADEPHLGALVAADESVVCVDAIEIIAVELSRADPEPRSDDPSPQPSSIPRIYDDVPLVVGERVPVSGRDPTPTPIVESDSADDFPTIETQDPTPTPIIVGRRDPTPTPIITGDREDPTPTPIMED